MEWNWKCTVTNNSLCQCQQKSRSLWTLPFLSVRMALTEWPEGSWGPVYLKEDVGFSFGLPGTQRAMLVLASLPADSVVSWTSLLTEDPAISCLPTALQGTQAREEGCLYLHLALQNLPAWPLSAWREGCCWAAGQTCVPRLGVGCGGCKWGHSQGPVVLLTLQPPSQLPFVPGKHPSWFPFLCACDWPFCNHKKDR